VGIAEDYNTLRISSFFMESYEGIPSRKHLVVDENNIKINPMKNNSIITSLLLAIFITGFAFAQEQLQGAEKNLLKPKPLMDECKMPVFPEMTGDTVAKFGKVIVLVTINDKGEVVASSIKREIPKGFGFGDAVAKVIDDWMYLPAYWNGKPTVYSTTETFFFKEGKVEYESREPKPAAADSTIKADVKPSE
jgi:hypothetical protein